MKATPSQGKRFFGPNALVVAAALVIVFAGLREAQALVLPFMFSVFLSLLAAPAVLWLRRKRVPTLVAVGLVVACIMGALTTIASVVGGLVNEFARELNQYRDKLNDVSRVVIDWLREYGLEVPEDHMPAGFDPATLLDFVVKGLRGVLSALSNTLLVLLTTMFMLFETASFRGKLEAALGTGVDLRRFAAMTTEVQQYLAVKTATSLLTGTLIWGWAAAIGVDFPLLWGLLAFLLNYIPVLGSIMAAVPAVLLAAVQLGLSMALVLAFGFLLFNISVSNLLEPVLMGRRLGLSPLVVFVSLVFWGWIWGPVGMLLSVPLTMVVKIFMENSEAFRWIAIVMDSKPRSVGQTSSGAVDDQDADELL